MIYLFQQFIDNNDNNNNNNDNNNIITILSYRMIMIKTISDEINDNIISSLYYSDKTFSMNDVPVN